MSEGRSTSAATLGWFSRTAGRLSVILLLFGCDGSQDRQESTGDPPTTGRADSEPERLEFFGAIVDPGPDFATGPARSEAEREGSKLSEDLGRLPAPLLLKAGNDPVRSVAFSPDGELVAAGDGWNEGFAYRGKLYLWETRSGKLIGKHEGFRRPVERISFSDSGKIVAASPRFGGPVIVWQVGQEDRKATLRTSAYVLGLTAETEVLVAMEGFGGEKDEAPRLGVARWRLDTSPKPEDVVIHDVGLVMGLSANKQVLFGYYPDGRDGRVVFWSTGDWKQLGEINVGEGDSHAISDDGRLFAVRVDVSGDGITTLDLFDVREQKLLRRCRYRDVLCNMVFHSSGEVLAENYYDDLFLRDLKTGHFFATWSPRKVKEGPNRFTSRFTMSSLAFSRDGDALAAGLFNTNEVALFRIAQSDLKRLRDASKTSQQEEGVDTEKRNSRDGAKD